jgi:Domain of unknown function (DUF4190)
MAPPQPAYPDQHSAGAQGGNGWAIASFVCGLVGMVLFFVPLIGGTVALLGIIFGGIGISRSKQVSGRGKGRAVAGIVCGSLGIAGAIAYVVFAVPAFKDYIRRSKAIESELQLHRIEKLIKLHYIETEKLPPSSTLSLPDVDGGACAAGGKMAAKPQSAWAADPAWHAIDFVLDEPSQYTYHWTKANDTEGYITAVGDLDCDGTMSTTRVEIHIVNGNITAVHGTPTPD